MRKYLLLTLLFFIPIVGQAEEFKVNEYMNDLYYANGIDTKRKQARRTLIKIIKPNIALEAIN